MTDSALLASRHPRTVPARPVTRRPTPAAAAPVRPMEDRLWCEHGWGLGAPAVAALVGLILLASAAAHFLG